MIEPLAHKMRPQNLDEIVGQKHLVGPDGIIRKCLIQGRFFSSIFFGPPGSGKTSLAKIIAKELNKAYRQFNAVTGNKKDLDAIFFEAKLNPGLILLLDEVHRLNKDKQDLLLPYIEEGQIILIGATTANPYHSINAAIRSRLQLFELKALSKEDIQIIIERALFSPRGLNNEFHMDEKTIAYLADLSGGDLRYAINTLELLAIASADKHIDNDLLAKVVPKANQKIDKDSDFYYNLLSALQKSIRGSDPNAALYYLAILAESDDLKSIIRRLLVIAYEDIGLANPALVSRTYNACMAADLVGFPEAIIPLGLQVIDLCLSPKSKSAIDATFKAKEIAQKQVYDMPQYLKFNQSSLSEEERYDYSRYDLFHKIQYLPDELKDLDLFYFNNNPYESKLKEIYDKLRKIKRQSPVKLKRPT